MVVPMNLSVLVVRCSAAAVLVFTLPGCDRSAPQVAALKAENERLKAEIAQLKHKPNGTKEGESQPGNADLILEINELWSQRFEDNEFRAKQRLSGKTIRVTGLVDGVNGQTISMFGAGKVSRSVRMSANLESTQAAKIQEGLASLEKGATVTVQGKFAFDRMGLDDSLIVDKETGHKLSADEILLLAQAGVSKTPPPDKK